MAFDFASITAPFRMQPGLRKLGPADLHLTANRPGSRALREKLAVLASFSSQAFVQVPGFDARPALNALCACAAREHPEAFRIDGTRLVAPLLGWTLLGIQMGGTQMGGSQIGESQVGWSQVGWSRNGCALEPVPTDPAASDPAIGHVLRTLPAEWRVAELLSLAFADDFAVIDGATARVPWLAVCLPSSWAPEQKVGLHFTDIHAPVADNASLVAAGEHLARLVTGPDRWERFVWSLTTDPRLHRHPARSDPSDWPADANARELVESAFLRTERQSFLPVVGAAQAVFTIHVEVRPLIDALTDADDTRRLLDALASMSSTVLAYRHLTGARERLLEGLRGWRVDA